MAQDRIIHTKRINPKFKRDLRVYYDKGGMNYWDYSQKPKGIYFSSMVYEQVEGSTSKTWTTGQKGDGYILVVPLERYSAKHLRLVCERVEAHANGIHDILNTDSDPGKLKRILIGEDLQALAA